MQYYEITGFNGETEKISLYTENVFRFAKILIERLDETVERESKEKSIKKY